MAPPSTYNAVVTLETEASIARVWQALTTPDQIKQFMHGADIVTAWRVGHPIVWRGEREGKLYEDRGVILAIETERQLSYTHWSPMSDSTDRPENYYTVTYELTARGSGTKLVLTQGNNPSQEAADTMAEKAWKPMMLTLKRLVSASSSAH
jgi:uncharacterized protein YndB with AHSA1/START domain